MDGILVAAALLSAALHAAWNAWVKAAPDPQDAMAAQVIGAGLASAALLAVVPLPPAASLPWLASSTLLNLLILGALVRGYALGGFGFVYPVARAVSPLLVALFATVLVGERLSPTGWAGVALVSGAPRLEAPFDSMTAMARLHFPYLPAALLRDTYRSDRLIGAVTGPILIVHGDADPVIPAKYGRRLADAAPEGTRFAVVPGDHISLLGTRDAEAEALFRARIPAPGCVAG
jgi:pimeloyl-ACP methyl ester carboxylesterase